MSPDPRAAEVPERVHDEAPSRAGPSEPSDSEFLAEAKTEIAGASAPAGVPPVPLTPSSPPPPPPAPGQAPSPRSSPSGPPGAADDLALVSWLATHADDQTALARVGEGPLGVPPTAATGVPLPAAAPPESADPDATMRGRVEVVRPASSPGPDSGPGPAPAVLGHVGTPVAGTAALPAGLAAADAALADAIAAPRYEVLSPLGKGGMGAVYRVRDRLLKREVALKVLHDHLGIRDDTAARFIEEARATARLQHPAIVPVYDFGVDERGRLFFTMKLVEGQTLTALSAEARAGTAEAAHAFRLFRRLEVFIEVARAIDYAHEHGIVHRDLKPHNVMIGRHGEVHVMDWGLAKLLEAALDLASARPDDDSGRSPRPWAVEPIGDAAAAGSGPGSRSGTVPFDADGPRRDETEIGTVLGTLTYMAPEQALGDLRAVGPLSDVFALGATLYHLLTGRSPYRGKGSPEMLAAVRSAVFEPPRAIDPGVPREVEAICLKAMAREPAARYASAGALADDVQAYLEHEPVSAYPEGALQRLRKWTLRHRRGLAAGLLATALVVGLGEGIARYERAGEARREAVRVGQLRDQAAAAVDEAGVALAAGAAAFQRAQPSLWERRAAVLRAGELATYFARPPATAVEAEDRLAAAAGHGPERRGASSGGPAAEGAAGALARWQALVAARDAAAAEGERHAENVSAAFRRARDLLVEAGDRDAAELAEARRLRALGELALARGGAEARGYLEAARSSRLAVADAELDRMIEAARGLGEVVVELPGAWVELGALGDLDALGAGLASGERLWVEVAVEGEEVDDPAQRRVIGLVAEPGAEPFAARARALMGPGERARRASTAAVLLWALDPSTLQVPSGPPLVVGPPAPHAIRRLAPGSYQARVRDPARAPATRAEPLAFPVLLAAGDRWEARIRIPLAAIPAGMAYVPEGPALVGSRSGAEDERPLRFVFVDAFLIARHEVTIGDLAAFAATGYRTEAEVRGKSWVYLIDKGAWLERDGACWRDPMAEGDVRETHARHPVSQVSHRDAEAFAAATGTRLATEREWEKAARGFDGRRYPWGEELLGEGDVLLANHWSVTYERDGFTRTAPVGSYPGGASPYGVLDMSGNVSEWTSTIYGPYSGPPPTEGPFRAFRGGGWPDSTGWMRPAARASDDPGYASQDTGFRVARDLPAGGR